MSLRDQTPAMWAETTQGRSQAAILEAADISRSVYFSSINSAETVTRMSLNIDKRYYLPYPAEPAMSMNFPVKFGL